MKTRGFTLIELLVAIAIIGILASIILVDLDAGRVRARDTKRITDINQIKNALEQFKIDRGYYPGLNDPDDPLDPSDAPYNYISPSDPIYTTNVEADMALVYEQLAPYLSEIPKDPTTEHQCAPYYCYSWRADRAKYHLGAKLERENALLNTDSDYNSDVPSDEVIEYGGYRHYFYGDDAEFLYDSNF